MGPGVESPILRVENEGRVRRLTLHRPEAANAFDRALCETLADSLQDAADDDDVRTVVVTGEGKVFSAGADLNDMGRGAAGGEERRDEDTGAPMADSSFSRGFGALVPALARFPKPLIAAVNGAAVGIGVSMLFHCDLVLLSDRARLRMPFTAMGVNPEAGSTLLLPRLIGRQQAARLLFTSEWVDAVRAVELGLALSVSPHDALLGDATALAAQISEHPLESLVATKQLLLEAERDVLDATIARESTTFAAMLGRPGARDRVLGQLTPGERER